jgi:hypothetical protein
MPFAPVFAADAAKQSPLGRRTRRDGRRCRLEAMDILIVVAENEKELG